MWWAPCHRPWRPEVDDNWSIGRDLTAEEQLDAVRVAAEEDRSGASATSVNTVIQRKEGE